MNTIPIPTDNPAAAGELDAATIIDLFSSVMQSRIQACQAVIPLVPGWADDGKNSIPQALRHVQFAAGGMARVGNDPTSTWRQIAERCRLTSGAIAKLEERLWLALGRLAGSEDEATPPE